MGSSTLRGIVPVVLLAVSWGIFCCSRDGAHDLAALDYSEVFLGAAVGKGSPVLRCYAGSGSFKQASVRGNGEIVLVGHELVHGINALVFENLSPSRKTERRAILFPEGKPGAQIVPIGPTVHSRHDDETVLFSDWLKGSVVENAMMTHVDRRGDLISNEIFQGSWASEPSASPEGVVAVASMTKDGMSIRTYDIRTRRFVSTIPIGDKFMPPVTAVASRNGVVMAMKKRTGTYDAPRSELLVRKFSLYGDAVWGKHVVTGGDVTAIWMVGKGDNDILLAAMYRDVARARHFTTRVVVMRLDSRGELVWEKEVDGKTDNSAFGLIQSNKGKTLLGVNQLEYSIHPFPQWGTFSIFEVGDDGTLTIEKREMQASIGVHSFEVDADENVYIFGSGWVAGCGGEPKRNNIFMKMTGVSDGAK